MQNLFLNDWVFVPRVMLIPINNTFPSERYSNKHIKMCFSCQRSLESWKPLLLRRVLLFIILQSLKKKTPRLTAVIIVGVVYGRSETDTIDGKPEK